MMTRRPPPLAERLFTWSLAVADREAVLGDLQEEFAALADASGAGAARRWYWAQTLMSVGPNVVRRIQGERLGRRMNESDSDRLMRKSVRTFSLWLIGVPAAAGVLAWSHGPLLVFVAGVGGPIALAGLLLLAANVFPHRVVDAETTTCRLRRLRFLLAIVFLGGLPRFFLYPAHRHFLREVALAEAVLVTVTLIWPRRYGPIRRRNTPQ